MSREFKNYLAANGVPEIRYHDLRHTNLSMLMTKMNAVAVAKLGGHKQVSTTTNIYGHPFDDTLEKGVETLEQIMEISEKPDKKDESGSMIVEVMTVWKKNS